MQGFLGRMSSAPAVSNTRGSRGRSSSGPYQGPRYELINPNVNITEGLSEKQKQKLGSFPEIKKELEEIKYLGSSPYTHRHEYIHGATEPIMKKLFTDPSQKEFLDKYKKSFTKNSDFIKEASKRDNFDYYKWISGDGGKSNMEWYGRLMDMRLGSKLDPSKNTTSKDWENIYNKEREQYEDAMKNKDRRKALEHEQNLMFFESMGKDYEKINQLNNEIVLNKKDFDKSNKFNNLLMSGVSKSNLFKAQDGLEYVQQLQADELSKNRRAISEEEKEAFLNNPYLLGASILDPTGISNYPYMIDAWKKVPQSKGFWNTLGNVSNAFLETAASAPMVGKAVAPIKTIKALSRIPKVEKAAVKTVNALTKIQPIAGIDKRLYPGLYKVSKPGILGFTTPIGRGTRFWKGVDEYGLKPLEKEAIKAEEKSKKQQANTSEDFDVIRIKQLNGGVKEIRIDSKEYDDLIKSDAIDPNSFSAVDSSYSLRKNR
jgi:hypothetical protein